MGPEMVEWIIVAQGHYSLREKLRPNATEVWHQFVSGKAGIGKIGVGDRVTIAQTGTGSVSFWGRGVVDEVRKDGSVIRYTERFSKAFLVPSDSRTSLPALAKHQWKDRRVPIFLALAPDHWGKYVPGHMTGVAFPLNAADASVLNDSIGGGPKTPFPLVFARIGWMARYDGPALDDKKPKAGGSHNRKDVGNEVFTFQPLGGNVYGYIQVPGGGQSVNLSRILGSGALGESAKGVTVVWYAKRPKGGQVIVGWYRNAEIYKDRQKYPLGTGRDGFRFVCRSGTADAVVLPPDSRTFLLPSKGGGLGRSNIVYALDTHGQSRLEDPSQEWMARALRLIEGYGPVTTATVSPVSRGHPGGGQGFNRDAAERDKLDAFAMARATDHFSGLGYKVEDEHLRNPYDLKCSKDGSVLYVEVKGTKSRGESVLVTNGEVDFAGKHPKESALFVCHSISLQKGGEASGGMTEVEIPWSPTVDKLIPVSFTYKRRAVV
jgi:hypothetical protein